MKKTILENGDIAIKAPMSKMRVLVLSGVVAVANSFGPVTGSANEQLAAEQDAEETDIRGILQASQKDADEDYPNGKDVKLTHFGYIGSVSTAKGDTIYVADQRGVITGMLAPRGLNFIACFDAKYRFLGKVRYVSARPLWCEGSRVFLFGEEHTSLGSGNVIDLAQGWWNREIKSVNAYGSYRKSEQGGADQPATALKSKSEGDVKQTHAEEIKKRELPACDPVATAKWLTSLYTLQEGKLTFCAEDSDRLTGQIPVAAKAKVSSDGDGMTIDQEGLLPVQYRNQAGYQSFFFINPLKHRNLADDFVPYGKDVAVWEDSSKFRTLGEALYTYFTGLALKKPDHHRVEDVLGYPADYYVWEVGGSTVFLKAYQGNDTYGLMLRVCSKETELGRAEIARQRSRISGAKSSAKKEVFEGWGEPLEMTND